MNLTEFQAIKNDAFVPNVKYLNSKSLIADIIQLLSVEAGQDQINIKQIQEEQIEVTADTDRIM